MPSQMKSCCFRCARAVRRPAVLAWAYNRPVACLCAACVRTGSPAMLRRFAAHVQLRYRDYYEDPAVRYSYRDGKIARLVGGVL